MKRVLVIGAGPAGLTAGLELVKNNIQTTIVEFDPEYVGGISRTVDYKGYKYDIGGHRFYTKNVEIENFWKLTLGDDLLTKKRKSRILYKNKYYDYPLSFFNALFNLGLIDSTKALTSYIRGSLIKIKPEVTYEDWMTNRFGKMLFTTFFKTYTEKIWGIPVNKISKDWAIQRVKTFSLWGAVLSSLVPSYGRKFKTLIDEFYYPRLGPGMMWNAVAESFKLNGGDLVMNCKVTSLKLTSEKCWSVKFSGNNDSLSEEFDEVISTMPLKSLIKALGKVPKEILETSNMLSYRDFITVLLVVDKPYVFDDNWIYIHSPEVKVGRIQNFKNWSEEMVPDQSKTSLGMEYFIFENDELWNKPQEYFLDLAKSEAVQLGICKKEDLIDGSVSKIKKAYPVYDADYAKNVDKIRIYLETLPNLYTVGRNGMHRWNNQDHSMMTGLIVARNIINGTKETSEWNVNNDAEYNEKRSEEKGRAVPKRI